MTDETDPALLAHSVLKLLQQDPRRYHNFGAWWYMIKALLKQYYTRDNLYLLGDYVDPAVTERLPAVPLQQALQMAIETYNDNARYNLGRAHVEDPEGETFLLFDADADI